MDYGRGPPNELPQEDFPQEDFSAANAIVNQPVRRYGYGKEFSGRHGYPREASSSLRHVDDLELSTSEDSLSSIYPDNADPTRIFSSGTKGTVSVHSIGVSVEDLWGENKKKTASLVFPDRSGFEISAKFNYIEALSVVLSNKVRSSVWRHFFYGIQSAPGTVLILIAIVFLRLSVLFSSLTMLCILIERIFIPSRSVPLNEYVSNIRSSPQLVNSFLIHFNRLPPPLHHIFKAPFVWVWQCVAHYWQSFPIILIAVGALFVELFMRPKLTLRLNRCLLHDNNLEKSASLSLIISNFCSIIGNILVFCMLYIVSSRSRFLDYRNMVLRVLSLTLIEVVSLNKRSDMCISDFTPKLNKMKDYSLQLTHLESTISQEESRSYIEKWFLLPSIERHIEVLRSSLKNLHEGIGKILSISTTNLRRKFVLSVLASLFSIDMYVECVNNPAVLRHYLKPAEKLLYMVQNLYYRHGIDFYYGDDQHLLRCFRSMLLFSSILLPMQLMISIFTSCSELSTAFALDSQCLPHRVTSSYRGPTSNQGWVTGALSDAPTVFDGLSLSENGTSFLKVTFYLGLIGP